MKNLFYWYLLIVGMWLFSSCTANLEQVETTDLDRESVFADSAYTARFLSQIYTDVGYDVKPNRFKTEAFGMAIEHGGLQTACDEAAYKVVSDVTNDVMFATGTINPVNAKEDDVWKIAYVNIRRANVFMKYVEGSPITENVKKQYKAEARFLRAWYYSMLLRHYGGVPLIGDNIYEVDDDMKTSRDTYADCVKYIVDECNLAALDLPDKFRGINTGRATAGSCKD
ncbi:RagB/SusD family nutrient uptake outer membrane protein [Bacteroides reticulotermitis]|nr:RagB/SusD family nutrient uptake outer membrane protein [Bacteroides reticulotermitis]